MHQRKSRKILIYFFLLIIVGTINNNSLNNIQFEKIKNINIQGLKKYENQVILKKIENLNLKNIFFINENSLRKVINDSSLIENYKIFKKYPSTLNIEIKRTIFLAKINKDGKYYLIGSNGKLSDTNFSSANLPFVFGNPDINEFLQFKNILDQSKISYQEIKNLYFFPSKRWDIELKNNVLIKLSNNYTKDNLNNIFEFLNNANLGKLKILDARIKNQIIIHE
jgi:cell division protein FtsQ